MSYNLKKNCSTAALQTRLFLWLALPEKIYCSAPSWLKYTYENKKGNNKWKEKNQIGEKRRFRQPVAKYEKQANISTKTSANSSFFFFFFSSLSLSFETYGSVVKVFFQSPV